MSAAIAAVETGAPTPELPENQGEKLEKAKGVIDDAARQEQRPRHTSEVTKEGLLAFAKRQGSKRVNQEAVAELEAELKGLPASGQEGEPRGQKPVNPVPRPAQQGDVPV